MNDLFNLDALHQQAQHYANDLAQKQAAKGFSFIKLHCYTDQDGTPIYWKIRLKNLATGEKWIRSFASGEHGFGYDPLFWVPERNCSSAELSPTEKNQLSHRARAMVLLRQRLGLK